MSFLIEFWQYLWLRKKYWLYPIIVVLALLGGIIFLSQGFTIIAPYIYTTI